MQTFLRFALTGGAYELINKAASHLKRTREMNEQRLTVPSVTLTNGTQTHSSCLLEHFLKNEAYIYISLHAHV